MSHDRGSQIGILLLEVFFFFFFTSVVDELFNYDPEEASGS